MTNNPVVFIFYHNCISAVPIIRLQLTEKDFPNVDRGVHDNPLHLPLNTVHIHFPYLDEEKIFINVFAIVIPRIQDG